MKKLLCIVLCIALTSTLLFACSSPAATETATEPTAAAETATTETTETAPSDGEVTTITVLRPGDEEKVASFMEPAIEAFEAANPNIKVEIMYESWAGWIQTYPTYFEADTQPDVIFWWDNKLYDSSAKDHIVNLSDYLSADFFAQIPDGVWNLVSTGNSDGVYYVPNSVDTFVLYYNKDVFTAAGLDPNAPPTTWDELLSAAKTIYEKTGLPGIGIPAITGSEVLEEFVGLFLNQATGAAILDSSSMPLFNNAEGLDALTFISELAPYAQTSPTEYGRGELRPLMRDGQLGMLIDGPWAVPTFKAAYGDDLDNSPIGITYVPVAPNGNKIGWAGTNGWIATRESTAAASAKLIEYLMSPDVLLAHHLAYGSAPLYESEFDNAAFQYDYWKVYYDEAQNWTLYGMIGRNSATPAAYYTALEEVWQQLVLGQITPEDALAAAAAAAEGVTARNN